MTHRIVPFAMGLAMAPMLLMALHGPLSRGEGFLSALGFVGAHVAIIALLALAALLLPGRARRVLRAVLDHFKSHLPLMLAGVAVAAIALHLFIHNGVA